MGHPVSGTKGHDKRKVRTQKLQAWVKRIDNEVRQAVSCRLKQRKYCKDESIRRGVPETGLQA